MSADSRPNIAALLLAAGLSERMGAVNKLTLKVGGVEMVRRAAQTLIDCGLDLFVVVGHERERVAKALSGLSCSLVDNPDFREGQPSSMRAGLDAIGGDYDGVIVALADQPLLDAQDVASLLAAYSGSDGTRIMVPFHRDQRGNPIILPAAIVEEIGERPMNFGCRKFIERNPERIVVYQAPNDHFTRDIDTPEALAALEHA
jgi:molybdenum cofactor cytidylyltransferase